MSSHLWKAYYEDDVDAFRQLLEAAAYNARPHAARTGGPGFGGGGAMVGSPGAGMMGTSPTLLAKIRKVSGPGMSAGGGQGITFTRGDINWRDANGLTLLHHAASSTTENGAAFANMLIEHPLIDLYVQDLENGWTALHRAFYFGNVSIARLILERDVGDALGRTTGHVHQTVGLIKVKDREGHGPLDLYAATIKDRTLRPEGTRRPRSASDASDEAHHDMDNNDENRRPLQINFTKIEGDELYTFGSNRNVSLGFGDEDDRQYPERITLRRPEHLLRRFYREHLKEYDQKWSAHDPSHEPTARIAGKAPVDEIPWTIRTRPLVIQNVHMSKLHSAVLTTDPESNLYVCGHGQGGRLGTGDERTRFQFTCVEGGALAGKRIATVALGQNHTLALTDDGEIFSWGNNAYGQLGYSLPKTTSSDEDPISTVPTQIFGPLKRETVTGIAASRIHSVAFTGTSLFTFGKNEGQLGIMDSDARSLEVQITPRKVAASLFRSSIASVSAIDKATVCLLENHDVWVFANYGYLKVSFQLEGFENYFLKQSFLLTSYDGTPNRIVKVTSGGDTVCALSSRGEVFTMSISQRHDNQASSSTTNPAKIRSAVATPQCVWSLKKGNMAARDVGVDADGSIIIATEEGSVWKRTKRVKIKDSAASGTGEYRTKDYKFSRIPGLTRVLAVRASAHGAYAAVRRDCDVTKTQIEINEPRLRDDLYPLLPLKGLVAAQHGLEDELYEDVVATLKRNIILSKDIEADLKDICERCLNNSAAKYDAVIATTTSDVRIPVHRLLLTGRSRVLRRGFRDLCETSTFTIPDFAVSELDAEGRAVITFQGLDILSLIDIALYLYTDSIVDFWHIRNAKESAHRYRQIRTELMKVALKLELVKLEPAVRQMTEPVPCLEMDMELAFQDPAFFYDGDVVVQLEDDEMRVHSTVVCARCPFFEGLFMGRAGGRWLAGRGEDEEDVTVDLEHIPSRIFSIVLRHLYADTGEELFDDMLSKDLDAFLDTVMDVLSAANELMLDRLSQICQSVIGRYVNARNACWLLNAISPSSVHEFKRAGLEYLCLNLEAMLQGHHLNELDEDLLQELDEMVRQNQLACLPFAKSGRAELDLLERNPDLAAIMDRSRQTKIDAVRLRSKFQDMETLTPGSLGDDATASPMQQKSRRRSSQTPKAEPERQTLKAKASSKDMMFAMDEEFEGDIPSPSPSPAIRPMSTPRLDAIASSPLEDQWYDSKGKAVTSPRLSAQKQPAISGQGTPGTPKSPMLGGRTPPSNGIPWSLTPLAGARTTDLRNIMEQASSSRTSSISQGIASARASSSQVPSPTPAPLSTAAALQASRLSQKDRKKMQQQATANVSPASNVKGAPWQTVAAQKVASLKDVIDVQSSSTPPKAPATTRASSTPQLTMRQTVANPKPASPAQKPMIGPAGQSPMPSRAVIENNFPALAGSHTAASASSRPKPGAPSPASSPAVPQQPFTNSKPIPHSIRHTPRPAEPTLQLSMSDIVAQQQLEKDIIRGVVAPRDLHEIQAEQEFQEWWENESKRVQEAERRASAPAKASHKKKGRGGGGAGGGAGSSKQPNTAGQQQQPAQQQKKGGRGPRKPQAGPAPS